MLYSAHMTPHFLRSLLTVLAAGLLLIGCQNKTSSEDVAASKLPQETESRAVVQSAGTSVPAPDIVRGSAIPKGKPVPSYQEASARRASGTARELINTEISQWLGRAVTFVTVIDNSESDWRFICGTPKELSGGAVDYVTTPYKDRVAGGYFEDSFCALLEGESGKYQVTEFDLGSTDSPVLTWTDEYDLPPNLIK